MNKYQKIIEDQLAMNKISWQKLTQNGLTSDKEIRIDFWFYSTEKENAKALQMFLEKETDYAVIVEPSNNSIWCVNGHTQNTTVSLNILNEWVEWMVIAGQSFSCEFDGWGIQL